MSIKLKVILISAVLILTVIVSTESVLMSLGHAKDDTDVMNVLGRQRMLTQAMAKSALGYASKGEARVMENTVSMLNQYLTQMRTLYTKTVIPVAKKYGIDIAMEPDTKTHTSVPFPATLTRMVNENFGKDSALAGNDVSIDIIAEEPVNPNRGYMSDMDKMAGEFLLANPDKRYSGTLEEDDKLYLVFYTADIATVKACASCHSGLSGKNIKIGDMLGIRKYKMLFSNDIAAGIAQLNPSIEEYENARKVFSTTLAAVQKGGAFPLDLKMSKFKSINKVADPEAQAKIVEVEKQMEVFTDAVDALVNSSDEDEARISKLAIGPEANKLRKLSNDLVSIFSAIAHKSQANIEWVVIISGLIVGVLALASFFILNYSVIKPIKSASDAMKNIAEGEGDLTRRLVVDRNDELGELSSGFNKFIEKIQILVKDITGNSKDLATSSGELSSVSGQLASGAELTTNQANTVASATEEMSSNINTMASAVEEMSMNISNVASSAEEMSANMNSVSSAIEEMTVSIDEISNNAHEASKVSAEAMEMSSAASTRMNTLGVAAKEIGEVTEVIKRIAEQTNLLALNATIEAASAGEAGKGFAVVANEIKELANQSANAAEDIASRIEGVQGNTNEAVKVISEVATIITSINESVEVITRSVEQQSQAAGDISANVGEAASGANNIASMIAEVSAGANDVSKNAGEAAKGVNEVSSNIQGVSQAANDSSSGAQQVNMSSGELSKIAGKLEAVVSKFKVA